MKVTFNIDQRNIKHTINDFLISDESEKEIGLRIISWVESGINNFIKFSKESEAEINYMLSWIDEYTSVNIHFDSDLDYSKEIYIGSYHLYPCLVIGNIQLPKIYNIIEFDYDLFKTDYIKKGCNILDWLKIDENNHIEFSDNREINHIMNWIDYYTNDSIKINYYYNQNVSLNYNRLIKSYELSMNCNPNITSRKFDYNDFKFDVYFL